MERRNGKRLPGQRGPGKAPGRIRKTFYIDLEDAALLARVRFNDEHETESDVLRLAIKHYCTIRIAEHAAKLLGSRGRCGCGLLMEPATLSTVNPNESPLLCPRCDAENG